MLELEDVLLHIKFTGGFEVRLKSSVLTGKMGKHTILLFRELLLHHNQTIDLCVLEDKVFGNKIETDSMGLLKKGARCQNVSTSLKQLRRFLFPGHVNTGSDWSETLYAEDKEVLRLYKPSRSSIRLEIPAEDPSVYIDLWDAQAVVSTSVKASAAINLAGEHVNERIPRLLSDTGSAPPFPAMLLGREDAVRDLVDRLIAPSNSPAGSYTSNVTVIRGWPGVGKSTLSAALAHHPQLRAAFPDGILWTALGSDPQLLPLLREWGRQLNEEVLTRVESVGEGARILTACLSTQRRLLIVDDVWHSEQGEVFRVGGPGCALLFTTRDSDVARALAYTAQAIYALPVLADEPSLDLLAALAPQVVAGHRQDCRDLCRELEGLPLALQVAGRLLASEAHLGFGVAELLAELRTGVLLLGEEAPPDYADLVCQTRPSVAVLLRRSTDRLTPEIRDCFALLGPCAPKPATFGLDLLRTIWVDIDPMPVLRTLVGRGLLEPLGQGRFQMHALLVVHARSMLTPGPEMNRCRHNTKPIAVI